MIVDEDTSGPDEVRREPETRARVRMLDHAIGSLAAGFVGGILGLVTLYTRIEGTAGRIRKAWRGWRNGG